MKEKIDMKKVVVSDHAVMRAKERFSIKGNNTDAKNYCKSTLGLAKYVGETICDKGNKGHLFSYGNRGVVMSLDLNTIVTIMKLERNYIPVEVDNPLQNKLIKLYDTEIRKFERSEKSISKKVESIKIKLNVELAELNLKIHRTRSNSIKIVCAARIKAINDYINEFEENLKNIQRQKKHVMYARVALG